MDTLEGLNRQIIRITTIANETSSPYNQFTLGRLRSRPNEYVHLCTYFSSDIVEQKTQCNEKVYEQFTLHSAKGNPLIFIKQIYQRAWELKASNIPVLAHFHQPILAAPILLLWPVILRSIPTVFTLHNDFKKLSLRNRLLSIFSFLLARHVTFVSESVKKSFPKILRNLKKKNWHVVQNGVDLKRIDETLKKTKDKNGIENYSNQCDLIAIGALVPQKNHDFLIDVIDELPQYFNLTIIGDGVLKKQLNAKAQNIGVSERLNFCGLLPRDEVFARAVKASAFVSCARWEGLPVAVMEAMAVSLPVFLSDIPPHRELKVNKGNTDGICLLPNDKRDWVKSLKEFAKKGITERKNMGESNRSIIEKDFYLNRMNKKYDKIYNYLL